LLKRFPYTICAVPKNGNVRRDEMMHGPVRAVTAPPFDRAPPHNLDLEQALLGAIFVNNEAYHRLPDNLEPRHFFEPLHQRIFEICGELIYAGKVASPITVKSFLSSEHEVGGLTVSQYLARLAAEATTVINAFDYGHSVRVLAARREMISLSEDLTEVCYEMKADESLRTIATASIERLDEIASIGTHVKASRVEIGRAADEAVERLGEMIKNPGARTGTPWGLTRMDETAPCLQRGDLTVMAGRPGMGKTGVALSCCLRTAKRGHRVAFFSLEMMAVSLATRAIADLCYDRLRLDFRRERFKPISYFDIAYGNIDPVDIDRIEDARRQLQSLPIVIDEQPATARAERPDARLGRGRPHAPRAGLQSIRRE
jgi:replicative DNA helicase